MIIGHIIVGIIAVSLIIVLVAGIHELDKEEEREYLKRRSIADEYIAKLRFRRR